MREPAFWFWRIVRTLVVLVVSAAVFSVQAWISPNITVSKFSDAFIFVVIISLLNALIWPILARITLPLLAATFGLGALVLNWIVILLAAHITPGVEVRGFFTPLVIALVLTAVSMALSAAAVSDDDDVYARNIIRRYGRGQRHGQSLANYPGVAFLEIDGLSGPIFRRAMINGYMPHMAKWFKSGSHKLVQWETDLSSQTGASQAGILLGHNNDIPAFQWVDKAAGSKFVAASSGKDAVILEQTLSDGHGVLAHNGHSIGNMFSGDAGMASITYSRITGQEAKAARATWYGYLASPYTLYRGLVMFIRDVFGEYRARWRARSAGEHIVAKRLGVFPLERAATNGIIQDINSYTVINDFYVGEVDAIYATYVGYDVVAHTTGTEGPDAMQALQRIDQHFGRMAKAAEDADRPYHLVVLSDHGQSRGDNFEIRYGMEIETFIQSLMPPTVKVFGGLDSEEGWDHVSVLLTETSKQSSGVGGLIKRLTKGKEQDGELVIGPPRAGSDGTYHWAQDDKQSHAVVIGSGNLGLLYFADYPDRLTKERIDAVAPNLIAGLLKHAGIGWIMVRTETDGTVVLGRNGTYYLKDDRIEGENPLAPFPPRAAQHLRRADGFKNAPDLYFNSFYDPINEEGASFEGQVGYHGGLGGDQARPFVFFPSQLPAPEGDLVGAEHVHDLFVSWLDALKASATAKGLRTSKPG